MELRTKLLQMKYDHLIKAFWKCILEEERGGGNIWGLKADPYVNVT